jgi:transcription elongation factor Elf1
MALTHNFNLKGGVDTRDKEATKYIDCPYCGAYHGVDEVIHMKNNETKEKQCDSCDNIFMIKAQVVLEYHTYKKISEGIYIKW